MAREEMGKNATRKIRCLVTKYCKVNNLFTLRKNRVLTPIKISISIVCHQNNMEKKHWHSSIDYFVDSCNTILSFY